MNLVVRGGTVVTSRDVTLADIAMTDGRITAVGPDLELNGADEINEIDAKGLHVFPGGIDSHVHFNEPGRTEWETIANGSAALAAGGYTTFIDMPLNNLPVTTDVVAFDLKLEALQRSSLVDFGFWGGLVPGNLDQLEGLAERGVAGFKAFMCPSGIDEFPACDEETLRAGMKRIAELGSILLVHAEDPAKLTIPVGGSVQDFLDSRPAEAETSAIALAISLAAETGCSLHIVHVSTARGAELIQDAQGRGVDVSGETCPHYLLYTQADLERLGGLGKCAPPFRTTDDTDALLERLEDGGIGIVVSDHSPSTLALKQRDDFREVWGGISSCQSTRQLLLALGIDPSTVAALTAGNIATRFGLPQKGDIAVGFDADLWLVDLTAESEVRRSELLYRNPFSAHEGRRIRGTTVHTMVRGQTVFAEGEPATKPAGRFIRPAAGS